MTRSRLPVLLAAAAMGVLAAAGAQAASVSIVDNFDSYATTSVLDFTGFSQLNVVSGTVDLIHNGDFGISSDSCCFAVDLNGSNPGTLATNAFSFDAGDRVSLTLDISGDDRGSTSNFSFGFDTTGSNFAADNVMIETVFGPGFTNVGNFPSTPSLASGNLTPLASNAPFAEYSIVFTAGSAGTVTAFVAGDPNGGDVGPILDNFDLQVTPGTGVPEPAAWALMIAGFGLAGTALRGRPRLVA